MFYMHVPFHFVILPQGRRNVLNFRGSGNLIKTVWYIDNYYSPEYKKPVANDEKKRNLN